MKKQFKNNGHLTLKKVLEDELFNKLKVLSKFYIDRTRKRQNKTGNAGHNLFRTDNIIQDFLVPDLFNNEKIYTTIYDILGKDFILKEMLHYFSTPNNTMQELHRDVNNIYQSERLLVPTFLVAIQIPLIDFDYSSGGTRIIDGTHLNFDEPTRIENENMAEVSKYTPTLKEKDCLIRDCRAWHGAGINKTESYRAMYTLAFAKSWFGKPAKVTKELYFGIEREKRHMVTV